MAEPEPEPKSGENSLQSRQRLTGKRASGSSKMTPSQSGSTPVTPCGACKFLRRKCAKGCIFAPHFSSDQGAALFAAVHKVFGASNVSKLLMQLPVHRRPHAVATISYEAQARLSDPVYGCISTVIALQQQVAALQTELAMVQNQLINNRLVAANALHGPQPGSFVGYSNDSDASNNNIVNMSSFDSRLQNLGGGQNVIHSQPSFDPLAFADQIL